MFSFNATCPSRCSTKNGTKKQEKKNRTMTIATGHNQYRSLSLFLKRKEKKKKKGRERKEQSRAEKRTSFIHVFAKNSAKNSMTTNLLHAPVLSMLSGSMTSMILSCCVCNVAIQRGVLRRSFIVACDMRWMHRSFNIYMYNASVLLNLISLVVILDVRRVGFRECDVKSRSYK